MTREAYPEWYRRVFGVPAILPTTTFYSTFKPDAPWGDKLTWSMMEAEHVYAKHLLAELDKSRVEGDLVEFGIYRGGWINIFCEHVEQVGSAKRHVWGFDSFEGLPEVDDARDDQYWKKGMYAADYDVVANYLKAEERSYLHLVKGWFSDSLSTPDATAISKIAYARIDGDLYQSCVDCLAFLDGRLTDGAILVFDDWLFDNTKGEPLAFAEWLERGASNKYRFTFLEMNLWGHLYLRVNHL